MTPLVILALVAGLVALVGGAELLVRGASRLAMAWGVPPLVVGLTVVAVGTSAPELAVSCRSALAGQADLAVGNVLGSNVFNVLVILGLAAQVAPLAIDRQLVRLDVPLMIGATFAVWWMALDGTVSRLEGAVLVAGIVVYTVVLIRGTRRDPAPGSSEDDPAAPAGSASSVGLVVVGLALLVLGADWLVDAASALARGLGVGERVIGLTLVSAGTSLPEVATSVVAAFRGQRDLAVGNVVGSNLFNILAVLGAAATVSGAGLAVAPGALALDFPVVTAVAVACLPIFFTGFAVDRLEGALFLVAWVGYTVVLYRGVDVSALPLVAGFLAAVALLTAVDRLRSRRSSP